MKILFITAHRLGDAVLSTAVLSALQEQYQHARFTIVCGPDVTDLFKHVPRCDAVIALPKKSYNRHWITLWARCVGTRWFKVVDLRSSLVSYGLRTHERLVVKGGRRPGHKVTHHARALGVSTPIRPQLWRDRMTEERMRQVLPPEKRWVALAPTAGSPIKAWPASSFIALAKSLEQHGLHPVIFYGPGAVEYQHALPVISGLPHAFDTGGRYTLDEVTCLLRQCRMFVGNDSGLMHMAAVVGVPTIGLFGPSCASQYAPLGPNARAVCAPGEEGQGVMEQLEIATVQKAVYHLYTQTETVALQKEMDDAV